MTSGFAERVRQWRPELSPETLALLFSAYIALTCNHSFWHAALAGKTLSAPATWGFLLGTFVALCGLHMLLLLIGSRRTIKPITAALLIASAMTAYYQDRYAVIMDPDMVRNVLHTEYREARELISLRYLLHVGVVTLPALIVLWRLRLRQRPWTRAALLRVLSLCGVIGVTAAGMLFAFRDLSALMRNHKEVRYLVTPGNLVYASARVLWSDARQAKQALQPVGSDARVVRTSAANRPRLLVIVVGETARAQNWGLNGYQRDTTPQLRALNVINFSNVHSCGTATEVSLPCMFSAVGRRDYDEARIRSQESLLHVLDHAGIASLWRDNQTGCKGVCAGLPFQQWHAARDSALCKDGLCLDEILLTDLQKEINAAVGDLAIVLHPLGNHGPSYFLRYPPRFRQFTPTCDRADLGSCSREQIVNSYDNALLYADHFVAQTIRLLQAQTARDTALIYLSDHGESLAEHGLYLHGVPYAIAPEQQTAVPMVAWLSDTFAANAGIDTSCLRRRSAQALTHDHLFHSVLGLLSVQTRDYAPEFDLFASCRLL